MTKEVIFKKRVRFIGMNHTSTTNASSTFGPIKIENFRNPTELTQAVRTAESKFSINSDKNDGRNNEKIVEKREPTELNKSIGTKVSNITINSTKKVDIKNVEKRADVSNLTDPNQSIGTTESNIAIKTTKQNNIKSTKNIEKRDDGKIEINFKDFEDTEGSHEAISPSFWQKFKKFSKSRIPVLCRLFSSYESAIENLMATYLNVGGLSAHKAIQNYCLSKISDSLETNEKPKTKMSGILSWVNSKLSKIAGKPKTKVEEAVGGTDEQNLNFYPNKLNIVIVSPESANIKQLENIIPDGGGDDDIEEIAMEDLQNELLYEMNEAKNIDIETPAEDENSKKKRSCFGFKCLNEEENSPKTLMAEDRLSDLNALSIAIKGYDKSSNHLSMGKSFPKERNVHMIENAVPEIENKRKTEKIDSFLYDLRDKKHVEEIHRPFETRRKAKNIEKVKENSVFQNLTNFKEFSQTTIYFCSFSVVFLILFIILIIYIRHRRKTKNLSGSNSSYDKMWYRRGEVVDDISDDDNDRLIDQVNHRRSQPPSLKVKGDRKSRKQSYLDDFKPVGPYRNKAKHKAEITHLIESENESLNESDYEINTKYKTSGTVTK